MNSDEFKINYFLCQKGQDHTDQQVNVVCLNPQCIYNPLCCRVCVNQYHASHTTTSLKKLLAEAKQKSKEFKKTDKEEVKKVKWFSDIDTDIVQNILRQSKRNSLDEYKKQSQNIKQTLKKIQQNYQMYYYKLELKSNFYNNQEKSKDISQTLEKLKNAQNLTVILPLLQKLLAIHQFNNKEKNISQNNHKTFPQLLNRIKEANNQTNFILSKNLSQTQKQLVSAKQEILKTVINIQDMFKKEIFKFSDQYKPADVWVPFSYKAISKKKGVYQIILMQPEIDLKRQVTQFKMKINKKSGDWIGVGIGIKQKLQKNNFYMKHSSTEHGCFIVSSNRGSWSSNDQFLNNKVLAYKFNEGDVITCIVDTKMQVVYFVKNFHLKTVDSNYLPEIYSLSFGPFNNETALHPCACLYYQNDQVQYIAPISSRNQIKYDYLFNQKLKHNKLKVLNKNRTIMTTEGNYKSAMTDSSLQDENCSKTFQFNITLCQFEWVAIGMCHRKTAEKKKYEFDYSNINHGYYMISSNGGSWSHLYKEKNNVVNAFKFKTGDTVRCRVKFGVMQEDKNNKIVFQNGENSYELNFKRIKGDPLHPCVMFYYYGDMITILPQF